MEGLVIGAALGAPLKLAFQEFYRVVTNAIKEARKFSPQLERLQSKLEALNQWAEQMRDSNDAWCHGEEALTKLMKDGKKLVEKCFNVGEMDLAKCKYGSKLSKLEEDIQKNIDFFVSLKDSICLKKVEDKLDAIGEDQNLGVRNGWSICAVPPPPRSIVAMDAHFQNLKRKLLCKEVSPLVVTNPEGHATTLVKKLGRDEQIKGAFKENIFFVLLSKTPNLKVIARNLFNRKGHQVYGFQSDEDAINQVGVLFDQIEAPILLILDDVWAESESLIKKLEFDIPNYQILVTSRTVFEGYGSMYSIPDQKVGQYQAGSNKKAEIFSTKELKKATKSFHKRSIIGHRGFGTSYKGIPDQKVGQYQAGSNKKAEIFSIKELKKATKNFHESSIIGHGGFGTCYKGILPGKRIVAIKKSYTVNKSQEEQFIKEVVALSKINHRNIVKLLGCCLETKFPLLVYEFISDRTLFEDICRGSKLSPMQWETRIKIAAEVAEALSYLHSKSIIHRDVKSANILLVDDVTPKVSNFGISTLVSQDQGKLVQGTYGYLDPKYLQTNQLTEKSDVYSFGVVLIELLIGEEAFSLDRPKEKRSLVMNFLSYLKKEQIFEVIDNNIVEEGNKEQIKEAVELANRCTRVNGDERPTMEEVVVKLERIRKMIADPSDNPQPNEQESEQLPGETSETYEDDGDGDETI